MSYDGVFYECFGDGERTLYEDDEDEADGDGRFGSSMKYSGVDEKRKSRFEEFDNLYKDSGPASRLDEYDSSCT